MPERSSRNGPSQRQLRVAEVIRKAMTEIFLRTEIQDPVFAGALLTITQVTMSPDIRNATLYVYPHGEEEPEVYVDALQRHAKFLRGELGRQISLKFTPALQFRLDTNLDQSEKIDALLRSPKVAQDLG